MDTVKIYNEVAADGRGASLSRGDPAGPTFCSREGVR